MERATMFTDQKTQYCKVSVVLKLMLRLSASSVRITAAFLSTNGKSDFKVTQKYKELRKAKILQTQVKKTRGLTLLDFQTPPKAIKVKKVWPWSQHRHKPMKQNRVRTGAHVYSRMVS